MTETIDQLIRIRFDAVANTIDDGDWADVLARSRKSEALASGRSVSRSHRRRRIPTRVTLVAAAVALAAVVTAVAFGLPRTFINFFSSPPAPTHIKNWFAAENVEAPPGMNPKAIPGQARRIASATFDVNHLHGNHPTVHTLYVAPSKGGGFCYLWTNADGGCLTAKPPSKTRAMRAMGPLGISWFSNHYGAGYPLFVDGWVRSGATKRVEARFADGTTATIPVTWISAPVSAGFLIYPVPPGHLTPAKAPTAVVALGASGNVIGKQSFPLTKPLDQDVMQTLPDGTKVSLQRRAQASRARKVISFRTTTGSEAYVWVMPRTGGGDCYLFNRGFGCQEPRFAEQTPTLGGVLSGSTNPPLLFFVQTKSNVVTVELRYQNGESERLKPIDGFALAEITPAHYKRGTRLAAAVALNRAGKAIYTQHEQPNSIGVYPCQTPTNLGHGVKACR
jgi:hypothetical protein